MTVETLKPFIKSPVESQELKRQNGNKTALVCHSIVLAIFYVGLLGFVIWNSVRVANLQKEVKHLNMLLDTMQKRLGFDLLDDLNEFEEAYGQSSSDDQVIPDKGFFPDDPDDYDPDLNNMEDGDEDYMDDELYGGSSEEEDLAKALNETRRSVDLDDSIYDDLDDLEDWDYKPDKASENPETADRKARSISSRSGVPIIEEPYPIKINKTVDSPTPVEPTMKYDWKEKKEQFMERKHKKYLEMRSRLANIPRRITRKDTSMEDNQISRQERLLPRSQIHSKPTQATQTIHNRPNRVMHTNDEKSQAYRQDTASSYPGQVVLTSTRRKAVRPMMHKSLEGKARQRTAAVHYVGDTSRYIEGIHRHYEGSGRLRHSGGVYVDWVADPAINNTKPFFRLENGTVTVHENGIYLIYAQIFYHNEFDTNGFRVEKNGEPFLLCTIMVHSNERVTKSNTCYTSGVTFLRADDNIRVADLAHDRHVILDPVRSYFGLVRLGPGVAPHHHGFHHQAPDDKMRSLDALRRIL